ncbi:MAG: DUF2480 family protein [Cytophagia bacterium]|nr:MAG: DUF2480 family protein [Cytophagia bacterium]
MEAEPITNRVATSSLITLDLEELYQKEERIVYDLKQNLWQGMILKEKDFREFLKNNDWTIYQDKLVAITCSADAIVPTWAYMLLSIHINPYAKKIIFGNLDDLENILFDEAINQINTEEYLDKKVVIKGCSKVNVPVSAYLKITNLLQSKVQSLMFGEACSSVPLYKKRKIEEKNKIKVGASVHACTKSNLYFKISLAFFSSSLS